MSASAHLRGRVALVLSVALLLASLGSRSAAQRVDPYLLVVFDTSSSMVAPPLDVTNSCSYTPTNKLSAAKCALSGLIASAPGARFGLLHFAQTFANGSCDGQACSAGSDSAMLRVPIGPDSGTSIARLVDNRGTPGASDPADDELCAPGPDSSSRAFTPLGGTLVAAREYFEGRLAGTSAPTAADERARCRPMAVVLLTDGVECCDACQQSAALQAGCPKANAELSALGVGECTAACTTVSDPNLCAEGDAFETAPERAYELRTESRIPSPNGRISKAIPTYVVGFGMPGPNDRIERIAAAGGTDNPSDGQGGLRGFYAGDDQALSLALREIVADAKPPAEVCNGQDDDCDGAVDEDTGGQPCGTDAGLCKHGTTRCVDGHERCEGGLGPMPETCNCQDDDCDGQVDELPDSGQPLCGEGVCLACQCTPHCISVEEFGERCPLGLAPKHVDGQCLCVPDDCDPIACAAATIGPDDAVLCAPDSVRVGPCECRAGACVPVCDGVHCDAGRVCDPRSGRCVEDTCLGLGCAEGETCDPLAGACMPDPCAFVVCASGEACRNGACERSCAAVTCLRGQHCVAGACEPDRCAEQRCALGEVCNPENGSCVGDACPMSCPAGSMCRAGGDQCEPDPCLALHCPDAQRCVDGECQDAAAESSESIEPRTLIAGTGGGGVTCAIRHRPAPSAFGPCMLGALVAAVLIRRQGRRGRS